MFTLASDHNNNSPIGHEKKNNRWKIAARTISTQQLPFFDDIHRGGANMPPPQGSEWQQQQQQRYQQQTHSASQQQPPPPPSPLPHKQKVNQYDDYQYQQHQEKKHEDFRNEAESQQIFQQQQQQQHQYHPEQEQEQISTSAGTSTTAYASSSSVERDPFGLSLAEEDPFHETVQDRVNEWRDYQQAHAKEQQSSLSPRDEQGRLKLLASVSRGTRTITFFVLMWRNVHLYEVVDVALKANNNVNNRKNNSLLRFMIRTPLTLMFIANLSGFVVSMTSPSHSSKKRLKAILNLDKFLELVLAIYYFFRLTIFPSKYIPREIYISNILHSVFFILQCQAITKVVWDEVKPNAMSSSYSYHKESSSSSSLQEEEGSTTSSTISQTAEDHDYYATTATANKPAANHYNTIGEWERQNEWNASTGDHELEVDQNIQQQLQQPQQYQHYHHRDDEQQPSYDQ